MLKRRTAQLSVTKGGGSRGGRFGEDLESFFTIPAYPCLSHIVYPVQVS